MITLIKNGDIYAPEYLGQQSILIAGGKIAKIGDVDEGKLRELDIEVRVINAAGTIVAPGLIDPHVHLTGGGGEGGFATRTPEIQLTSITSAGVTTVVGCLGTDATTRHMTSLLAKARGLEEEGLTTYIYTGNYHIPTPTITGSVKDDVILIDKIIGAGEIAISDSRSAQPSVHETAKLVAEARIGGLLSNKAGVTHFHVGPGEERLSFLQRILDDYEIPPSKLYATHITRSRELVNDAMTLSDKGAFVDMTADASTAEWIRYFKDNGGNMNQLTLSSDGNGSLPKFNDAGELLGLGVASPNTLYEQVVEAVQEAGLSLTEVFRLVTTNTANALCLDKKGCLGKKYDADVIVLEKDALALKHVLAKGQLMVADGEPVIKGTFE